MVVAHHLAEKTKNMIVDGKGLTGRYVDKSYPIGHTVCPEELADVKEFLQSVIPPDDECRIRLKDPSEMSIKELKAAIRKNGLTSQARGLCEKSEFIKLVRDHRDGKL